MKNHFQSPLPFQGQKRRFVKQFKQALKGFSNDATYVDLFGGSGLLSHTVKQEYPDARVIWNDYDDYAARLDAIPQTNALLTKFRGFLERVPRKQRIDKVLREKLLEVVKQHELQYGYVDYVSLSGSLLFSSKYAVSYEQFAKETFYNRIKMSDYDANGYLLGVERVQCDYRELYDRYRGAATVFLVDPPYLSTDTSTYSSDDYWKLRDYLDVLNVLEGSNYFYFTSNKSQILELCEWIETRTSVGNPFKDSTINTTANTLNHNSGYTDIMLYKYL